MASNEGIKEKLKEMRESVQKSIDELEEEKHKIMKKMEKRLIPRQPVIRAHGGRMVRVRK